MDDPLLLREVTQLKMVKQVDRPLKKLKRLKFSQMNRVKWKGPYIKNNLLKKVKSVKLMSKSTVQTISKNSIILPSFIELSFRVYNGKTFTIIKVTDEMIGHKLGEFVPTRTQFFYKKSKNK